ncbi:hypothetical protein K0M31_014965 [Melipona bicolor]|uniref:Uncharacterized protein n=1 Tax=Melipona bicolor TaxID=60889 RepID=A0AA40KFX5_9HYME|nr:hypothetical protein K0M31_014965 [Melipona bicolor]
MEEGVPEERWAPLSMIDLTKCFTRRENVQEDPHSEQQEIKRAEIASDATC